MSWSRADFPAFQANSYSYWLEKRGNMHRPGHFAADSFKSDRLLVQQRVNIVNIVCNLPRSCFDKPCRSVQARNAGVRLLTRFTRRREILVLIDDAFRGFA